MTRQEFDAYCEHFNSSRGKADVFDRYYDPNALFEHPFKGAFKGRDAIVEFWTTGHKGIREALKPVNALFDADRIAAEFIIEWGSSGTLFNC
ncbi:MAG: nuclear transport factor 2 family protein [bacterium]